MISVSLIHKLNSFQKELLKYLNHQEFCKSTSHISPNIPHPSSPTSCIPHFKQPTPQHPKSGISHILNIPIFQHLTPPTPKIPNIPPQTFRILNIPHLNISHPKHCTDRTFHTRNKKIIMPLLLLPDKYNVTRISSSVSSNVLMHALENIRTTFEFNSNKQHLKSNTRFLLNIFLVYLWERFGK